MARSSGPAPLQRAHGFAVSRSGAEREAGAIAGWIHSAWCAGEAERQWQRCARSEARSAGASRGRLVLSFQPSAKTTGRLWAARLLLGNRKIGECPVCPQVLPRFFPVPRFSCQVFCARFCFAIISSLGRLILRRSPAEPPPVS